MEVGQEMETLMWDEVAKLDKDKEAECNKNGIVSVPVSDEFLSELSDITKQIRSEWYDGAPEDAKKIYDEFLEAVGRKK